MTSPLEGSPLHRCLTELQQAKMNLEEDTNADFGAADRLRGALDGINDAIASTRAELNRRHLELKRKPAPPKAATFELKMPGRDAPPVFFAKTTRGIQEMFRWVNDAMSDGGAGIVVINNKLYDKLAEAGFGPEVLALRMAAQEELTPAGED